MEPYMDERLQTKFSNGIDTMKKPENPAQIFQNYL